jgi:two-component system, NtrC family, sensor kinase
MKSFVKISLLCLIPIFSAAQTDPTWGYLTSQQVDSLKRNVESEKNDTLRMAAYRSLGFYYQEAIPDSGLYFHEQQLALAKKLDMKLWLADAYSQTAFTLVSVGDVTRGYEYHTEATKLASNKKNESDNWRPWTFSNSKNSHEARISILAMNYQMMGNLWGALGEKEKRKSHYLEAAKLGESINNGKVAYLAFSSFARTLPPDSQTLFQKKALKYANAARFPRIVGAYSSMATIFFNNKMFDSAYIYVHKAILIGKEENMLSALSAAYAGLSNLFSIQNQADSCLFYANKALEVAQTSGVGENIKFAYRRLSVAYELKGETDKALKFQKLSYTLNDSLKNLIITNLTKYQNFSFNEQLRLKKLDEEKTAYANKMNMLGLIALLTGILVVALILFRNNRQKQKANKVLEITLTNLKSTQSQLVQSEKMASLGELTAGIAHEIQNPLNFVNNFSEVNTELIDEMKEELKAGKAEDAISLADDIKANNEKIAFHGKRADSIVKGMLQHSRSGSSQKEPTDINNLLDECLRLSFHGMRAKDKSFNAKMETSFDSSLGSINIVSQEIGRVFLNLFTNAFYSLMQKKIDASTGAAADNFSPVLSATTQKEGNSVRITVRDNGNGIPQKAVDKIFQPFFTTKPTGEGTGLGLSMSYDIITKGHGGELKVNTKEGEWAEFIIILPMG